MKATREAWTLERKCAAAAGKLGGNGGVGSSGGCGNAAAEAARGDDAGGDGAGARDGTTTGSAGGVARTEEPAELVGVSAARPQQKSLATTQRGAQTLRLACIFAAVARSGQGTGASEGCVGQRDKAFTCGPLHVVHIAALSESFVTNKQARTYTATR